MKKFLKLFVAFTAIGSLVSCDATVDDESLPAPVDASKIDISVTADATNLVTMKNNTPGTIAYWEYKDAAGNLMGTSNLTEAKVMFPFKGTYDVFFTAYSKGGAVPAEPVSITLENTNESYFAAPEWEMLSKKVEGKTWVVDMSSPIGWAGLDYPYNPSGSDAWSWLPTYAEASWAMPDKNWGEMTFDLDGAYNVSVTQTALNDDTQTTKTGTFSFDIAKHKMKFNGGVEMLYGGDYHPDCSDWTTLNVIELTETSMRLAVIRDQSRTGEGKCQIVFHFKPKE
ncbi:hypothetical protein [Flavobacterium sp. AG291]|uniref:hypothetical protein n=1 Tax=Flavobacterium sp. AG291 TaxID=2184000 RepID=UPI000E0B1EFC|nr:hypothetical protein [Flavobacterium sp. AG291]RDI10221.1 hypothetical protein DEU42_10837 [Flavobacterium sp. AG291]